MLRAEDIKFRCSSLGYLMSEGRGVSLTEKQSVELDRLLGLPNPTEKQLATIAELERKRDNPELPQGVKTHLVDVMTTWLYGYKPVEFSKYMEKGKQVEEDAITLLSIVGKMDRHTQKNEIQFDNGLITGTPDIYKEAEKVGHEIKSSWNPSTFMRARFGEVDNLYEWQCKGYMWLTGAKEWYLHRILVNATPDLINDEKRRALNTMRCSETDDDYIEACKQIEVNMIYDVREFTDTYPHYDLHNPKEWDVRIPMEQRIYTVKYEHDPKDDERIEERVWQGRNYILGVLAPQLLENLNHL